MISGKWHIIFNFGSKALYSRAKIEPLHGKVRIRAANVIEGSECILCPNKISCGPIFVFLSRLMQSLILSG